MNIQIYYCSLTTLQEYLCPRLFILKYCLCMIMLRSPYWLEFKLLLQVWPRAWRARQDVLLFLFTWQTLICHSTNYITVSRSFKRDLLGGKTYGKKLLNTENQTHGLLEPGPDNKTLPSASVFTFPVIPISQMAK